MTKLKYPPNDSPSLKSIKRLLDQFYTDDNTDSGDVVQVADSFNLLTDLGVLSTLSSAPSDEANSGSQAHI